MKIYTRVVMDMTRDDLPVLEAESYEYDGPMELAMGWGDDGPGRDGMGIGGEGVDGEYSGPSRGSRSTSTNAAGFGLGSPMGGSFGERGGVGYSGAAGRAEGQGIGPSGGYERGFDNRDERGLLQSVSREDKRAISQARDVARRNAPQGWRDNVANIFSAAWSGLRGLGAMVGVASGPVGMISAGRWGYGMYNQMQEDAAYREAAGLPSLSAGNVAQFDNPDQGESFAQVAATGSPQGQPMARPLPAEDILARTRAQLAEYDPETILESLPSFWAEVGKSSTTDILRRGIPELLQKRSRDGSAI